MRTTTKAEKTERFFAQMSRLGFDYEEANKLRLIEKTLHRWGELECGDGNECASWSIERDEETGTPYLVTHPHQGKSYRRRVADREAGALRRAQQILASHPDLWLFHQTDPRGCALYIGQKSDLDGLSLGNCYTRGTAVCID